MPTFEEQGTRLIVSTCDFLGKHGFPTSMQLQKSLLVLIALVVEL
jgi:hypothetical protein